MSCFKFLSQNCLNLEFKFFMKKLYFSIMKYCCYLLFSLIIVSLFSCNIEKRLYRQGYHITHSVVLKQNQVVIKTKKVIKDSNLVLTHLPTINKDKLEDEHEKQITQAKEPNQFLPQKTKSIKVISIPNFKENILYLHKPNLLTKTKAVSRIQGNRIRILTIALGTG